MMQISSGRSRAIGDLVRDRRRLTIRRMAADVDVRDVLPVIRAPTLVLNMPSARGEAEYVTARIPARSESRRPAPITWSPSSAIACLTKSSSSCVHSARDTSRIPCSRPSSSPTSSVPRRRRQRSAIAPGPTSSDGITRWCALHLDRFRGREMDTAGDGFFAAFDGPIRAIRCATTIGRSVLDLGLEVRAGLHTGECETVGKKLSGLAVNIGARVSAQAQPGEVLVTSTVKDLVAGSGIGFQDRGLHELKGVPGEWRLYTAIDAG